MQARHAAVLVISAVVAEGRSLSVLHELFDRVEPTRDRALAMEMAYGVLRWRWRLDAILRQLLSKPLKKRDQCLNFLLWVGLYQLIYMRIPPHAAVTETVDATEALEREWARGLVNACLRRFQREQAELQSASESSNVAAFSYPQWWLQRLQHDWPDGWREIACAGNERAPMTLRVNAVRQSRSDYARRLAEAGLDYELCDHADNGIRLRSATDVGTLPGFGDGDVSVQDEAAQLVPDLIDLRAGQRVLDACAAPGGKACHMAERVPSAQVVAVDVDAQRMTRLEDNVRRLGVQLTAIVGDVGKPELWWDGAQFDRILLDAPCSASGVVRRHPDIKSLRCGEDIAALAATQLALLEKLWPLLRPGGILLYVTCSVFREENDAVVSAFLRQRGGAARLPIEAAWGHSLEVGRQILPGEQLMDGFFFARIVKKNENV